MIEIKDRIPSKPNRILIKPEDGSKPFYAIWERADEPIEEGTPVNKLLFDSIDEGGIESSSLGDVEMECQTVHAKAEWTNVTFNKTFFGIPKVLVSTSVDGIVLVQNVTNEGCQVAVKGLKTSTSSITSTTVYSYSNTTTELSYVTGYQFIEGNIDLVAIYDGGL